MNSSNKAVYIHCQLSTLVLYSIMVKVPVYKRDEVRMVSKNSCEAKGSSLSANKIKNKNKMKSKEGIR